MRLDSSNQRSDGRLGAKRIRLSVFSSFELPETDMRTLLMMYSQVHFPGYSWKGKRRGQASVLKRSALPFNF